MQAPKENFVKIFDFAADEPERVTEIPSPQRSLLDGGNSNTEDKLQIDIEAEFSKVQNNKITSEKILSLAKEANKIESIDDMYLGKIGSCNGSFRSLEEPNDAKEPNMTMRRNVVNRSKSTKTVGGFKLFKRKFFSKSMKTNSTKSKTAGNGSRDLPSWDSYSGIGPSTETLADDKTGCHCDETKRITELENTIEQIENEKNKLEGEKLDLMNALSNIWIEMEDLKMESAKDLNNESDETQNDFEEEKIITRNSFGEFHDDDVSIMNTKATSSKVEENSNSRELSHQTQEGSKREDLGDQIKALTNSKNLQSETLHSLRIKLSALNEDKNGLSRKLNGMFEKNKALEEEIQKSIGKTEPELEKILQENVSLRARLANSFSEKLLVEKKHQKLKIEKKKQKLMKLQVQKTCENLIQRIDEVLRATAERKVADVPSKPENNPNISSMSSSSSYKLGKKKALSVDDLESSEVSPNLDSNGNLVKQIVRVLEKAKSSDTEARARDEILKGTTNQETEKTNKASRSPIRRSETLNTKSNSNLRVKDGKGNEIKVNRFPPLLSKTDKFRKDLKSLSGDEISFRSFQPTDPQSASLKMVIEKESDPFLKFFEHLEAKCLFLLERFKELNVRVEWLEQNSDIWDLRTVNTKFLPVADFENTPAQGNQKDSVLLSCLRNLQKENDSLKLDNLKYKALVGKMQDQWTESLSERIEDVIKSEKESIQRAEKDLRHLETRVIPEKDVGMLESNKSGNIPSNEFIKIKTVEITNGKDPEESEGIKIEQNHFESEFSALDQQQEKDMSSWHRKHSEKKSKDSGRALRVKETAPLEVKQRASLEGLHDLDMYSNSDGIIKTERQRNEQNISRGLSLDEGKDAHAKGQLLPSTYTMETDQSSQKIPKQALQRNEQGDTISASKISTNDKPALGAQAECCHTFKLHGHHHHQCSSILARLKMTLVDKVVDAPPKHRQDNKLLKKAMSTCGSRDRLYKVHYV